MDRAKENLGVMVGRLLSALDDSDDSDGGPLACLYHLARAAGAPRTRDGHVRALSWASDVGDALITRRVDPGEPNVSGGHGVAHYAME